MLGKGRLVLGCLGGEHGLPKQSGCLLNLSVSVLLALDVSVVGSLTREALAVKGGPSMLSQGHAGWRESIRRKEKRTRKGGKSRPSWWP